MITIIAGKSTQTSMCKIISLSDKVGIKREAEFEISDRCALKAGQPKWANYVKGCVAKFPCMFVYNQLYYYKN